MTLGVRVGTFRYLLKAPFQFGARQTESVSIDRPCKVTQSLQRNLDLAEVAIRRYQTLTFVIRIKQSLLPTAQLKMIELGSMFAALSLQCPSRIPISALVRSYPFVICNVLEGSKALLIPKQQIWEASITLTALATLENGPQHIGQRLVLFVLADIDDVDIILCSCIWLMIVLFAAAIEHLQVSLGFRFRGCFLTRYWSRENVRCRLRFTTCSP